MASRRWSIASPIAWARIGSGALAPIRATSPSAPWSAARHSHRARLDPTRAGTRIGPGPCACSSAPSRSRRRPRCLNDPPVFFRWRGQLRKVRRSEGPERLAEEWWRRPPGENRPRPRARLLPRRRRNRRPLLALPRRPLRQRRRAEMVAAWAGIDARPRAPLRQPATRVCHPPPFRCASRGRRRSAQFAPAPAKRGGGPRREAAWWRGCGPSMTAYAELQVTTNFGFLRGASHPEELVPHRQGAGTLRPRGL